MTKFRELAVGDSFDCVNPARPTQNSFYKRCTKTGTRTYSDEDGAAHRVGSINAKVFHVQRAAA